MMPLSDNEQRLLDEMERNLYKNEADVVSTSGLTRAPNYSAIVIGVLIGLVGIITMVVGVYVSMTIIGIVGFAVLFGGVMVAATIPSKSAASATSPRGARAKPATSSTNLMDRLNERWERRQGGDRF
jgi:uncharacterized membrane protein